MDDTEKLFLFGLIGLIAWELWPKSPAPPSLISSDPLNNTPIWIQQLSAVEQNEYMEEIKEGDIFENLLSIPQGPGGTYNYDVTNFQPINFFNPTRGIMGFCNQTPGVVTPRVWRTS